MGNVTDLEEFGAAGHNDACADEQHQADFDPDEVIDHIVNACQLFKKRFHRDLPK